MLKKAIKGSTPCRGAKDALGGRSTLFFHLPRTVVPYRMSFTLNSIVPWGRSFQEYRDMFNLGDDDLQNRIISCGDGPAGFNAAMHAMGFRVVSCDPLFAYPRDAITGRIQSAGLEVMKQVRENITNFVWEYFRDPEDLSSARFAAMNKFLEDYNEGRRDGRYICCILPDLPFGDRTFDLALCSHLLFLYPHLGPTFHLRSLMEMLRVAGEVRVYPLVDLNCETPPFLGEMIDHLTKSGYACSQEHVRYNFLRNGDKMLKISPF